MTNPFDALRGRAPRYSPDRSLKTTETYRFEQPRRFWSDKSIDEQTARQRLEKGQPVVVLESRDAYDHSGNHLASEVARVRLDSMPALEAYARVNTGRPEGEAEELATAVDELHFKPLDGKCLQTVSGRAYDQVGWEVLGNNFTKTVGPRSDGWLASQTSDEFVDVMSGQFEVEVNQASYDAQSGQWIATGTPRELSRSELKHTP